MSYPEPKYPLRTERSAVYLGDKKTKEFFLTPPKLTSFDYVTHVLDIPVYFDPSKPKERNQTYYKMFGPVIHKRFSAAMHDAFILRNFPEETRFALKKVGVHWKQYDPRKVNKALKNLPLFEQAVRDKNTHLLPLMLYFEQDTQALKSRFGKGLWKKICSSSKYKLLDISMYLDNDPEWFYTRTSVRNKIKNRGSLALVAAKIAPSEKYARSTFDLVYDTHRLARRHGEEVNLDWSLPRWEREHERLTQKNLNENYSNVVFSLPHVVELTGYTFTKLTTEKEIAEEGRAQHHCVASYAKRASSGSYAVYRIEGLERATLGLLISTGGQHLFNQCYGSCNRLVSEELINTCHAFVYELNKNGPNTPTLPLHTLR